MSENLQDKADIKRSSRDFSFIDIASNAIMNDRFMTGYKKLKNGEETDDSYLWLALSAIAQDSGETIYQNVLNYIDLASNIDLCKVSALRSMISEHGVKYQVLDKLKNMPIELENMIDVLSINKKYLLKANVIDKNLIDEISQQTIEIKDADISDYAKVEYKMLLDSLSVDAHNLVQDSISAMPHPNCMLGYYEPFYENGYDNKDENWKSDPTYNDFSINVFREYINWQSLSIANYDEYTTSSYFTVKKFSFKDDDLSVCRYGIYLDVQKETYDEDYAKVDRLSCSMYSYLGGLESVLNNKVGYEAEFKNAFDIDYEIKDLIDRYNAVNFFKWSSTSKGAATNIMAANLGKSIYISAFPSTELEYKNTYIDDDKYLAWLVRRFTEELSSACSIGYIINGVEQDTPIYEELRKELAEDNPIVLNNINLSSNARIQKLLNDVELTFNEKHVADDIEAGKDFLFNYSGVKKELIEAEIASRHAALSSAYNDYTTRTSYYRQEKVKQYFKFIENMVWLNQDITALGVNYELDWNMFKQDKLGNIKKLIGKNDGSKINLKMVVQVARILANITMYISQLREQLKIQAQKNYMKGTLNLLSYIVNEYLCQYAKNSLLMHDLRYISPTRLSVDGSKLFNNEFKQFEVSGIIYDLSNIVASCSISSQPGIYALSVLPTNGSIEDNIVDLSAYRKSYDSKLSSFSQIEADYNAIVAQLSSIKANLSNHLYDDVGIIEYDDVTEYYNIKTDTSKKSKVYSDLNNKFWDDVTNTNTNTQFAFTDKAIEDFYKNVLNMSSDVDDINDFLNVLYEVGASKSYIGKDDKLHVEADTTLSGEKAEEDIQSHVQMFLKFGGQDVAYMPYYNSKNKTHPSYQIHPYLYSFIKTVDFISPIKNGFTGILATQAIEDNVMSQMKTNIGKNGEIIDVWKNNSFDFSGYMSRYEQSSHQSSTDTTKSCEVIDYEGIFYPPAIEELLKSTAHTQFAINTIAYPAALSNCEMSAYLSSIPAAIKNDSAYWNDLTFYHKYYDHLKLSNFDRNKVINQLSCLALESGSDAKTVSLKNLYIMSVAAADADKPIDDLCYDIYKYGTDMYGNNYMLLKKYPASADYEQKQNTPGELFIRLKDHPIAVPAFGSDYQAVSLSNMNGALSNVLDHTPSEIFIKEAYFYDMEFDSSKRSLLLNSWPIRSDRFWNTVDPDGLVTPNNRKPDSEYVKVHYANLKRLECSQVIICDIDQQVDTMTNETKLMLKHDENGYDSIFQSGGVKVVGKPGDKILTFVGYMNDVKSICPTYIIKTLDSEKPLLLDKTLSILQEQYTWHSEDGLQQISGIADLNAMPALAKCSYLDSSFKMSYYNDVLTFATLATRPHRDMLTYFGKLEGKQLPEVSLSNDFTSDDCSIDLIDQYVVMFDMRKTNNTLSAQSNAQLYNVVVDASYLPLYPNQTGRLDIGKSNAFKQQSYQTIELLGNCSDIDGVIEKVNPSADFSFEHEDLTAAISGRIFEDYPPRSTTPAQALSILNDILHVLHNVGTISLQTLPTARDSNGEEWSYWSLDLPFAVSAESDKRNAQKSTLVFSNSRTTAKNMYYVGHLSSLLFNDRDETDDSGHVIRPAEEIVLYSKSIPYLNYNKYTEIHEKQILVDEADVKVTGTYNIFEQKFNITDSNNIVNVDAMKIAMLYGTEHFKLVIYFKRADLNVPSFVEPDVFKFTIYNPHMLKLYEVFHMLDEAGVYYCNDNSRQYYLRKYDPNSPDKDNPRVLSETAVPRLQDIDFDDKRLNYNYLSDIPGLSGFVQNLAFKLDEETIFNIDHPHFYFPGYNENFPTFIMNIIQSNASRIEYDKIFSKDQCFVFTVEDKKEVADNIGTVEIPISKYDTYCLRAYEDYDPTLYQQNDAQNIEFVKFSTDEKFYNYTYKEGKNVKGLDGLDFDRFVTIPGSNIDFDLDLYKQYGLLHTTTEGLAKDFNMDVVSISASSKNTDLGDLLDIYVNYKKELDGSLTLYFNYFNYINTPFVTYEDNKLKMNTIKGTYLKLEAGHSGVLDLVVQFNVYNNGNELRGTRSAVIKSYLIHNISDDKPKFLINRIRSLEKDSLKNPAGLLETYVIVNQQLIDLDDDSLTDNAPVSFMQEVFVSSSKTIQPGMKFQLYYNTSQLQFDTSKTLTDQIEITGEADGSYDGILNVTTKAYMTNDVLHIPFKTVLNKNTIVKNGVSTYDIDIDDTVTGTTVDNIPIDPVTSSGGATFGYQIVLRKEIADVNQLVLLEDSRRILLKRRQYEN